jgi:hypothetical protein
MLSKSWLKRAGLVTLVFGGLALSGCGTTQGDRALSGGLLGAGTGALIGSVTGSAGKGALIGGLGGLAIGALTSPRDINLGEPIWRRSSGYRHHHYANRTTRTAERCTTRYSGNQRITTCSSPK